MTGLNAPFPDENSKAEWLRSGQLELTEQSKQLQNPDARIIFEASARGVLLKEYADSLQGIISADYSRFGRFFWEVPMPYEGWAFQQSTVPATMPYGGRDHILYWENGKGALSKSTQARIQGLKALGNIGVAIVQMRRLPCTLYTGELFDNNIAVILPKRLEYLPAIWAFCQSSAFNQSVRHLDTKINVTNATLKKVPFDIDYWRKIAEDAGPLPEPHSDDPTQWLFDGHLETSSDTLQVAVARLLGYHWPQQKLDSLGDLSDADGIVCLPPVSPESPAAERLRALLAAAYGKEWSAALQDRLLKEVGYITLEDWLRDGFFAQHCALFHNRPFIWQIWDGIKDGFSALVNYHKLDHEKIGRLIYTYLGDWIKAQRHDSDKGVAGAEGRLVAALNLQKNSSRSVKVNHPTTSTCAGSRCTSNPSAGTRTSMTVCGSTSGRSWKQAYCATSFTVDWRKDRGKNPDGSERMNDLHYTIAEKQAARRKAGK